MERNFCIACENELKRIFKEEFDENLRIEFNNYNLCIRNFLDKKGILKSCLCRLIDALLEYRKDNTYHLINSEIIE